MSLIETVRSGPTNRPSPPSDIFFQRGRVKEFAAGDVVFNQGSPCCTLYQVRSGFLCLRRYMADGRSVIVRMARPGDVIGWSEAAFNHEHRWEGGALSNGWLSTLPVSAWLESQGGGGARERLLGLAYQESLLLENAMSRLVALRAEERLLTFLLSLASDPDRYPVVVRIPLRRIYVSEIVAITPESCSRMLARMVKAGAIKWRDRNVLLINEPEARRLAPLVEQFWALPVGYASLPSLTCSQKMYPA